MIVFEKIRYKNFLSTGNAFTEVNLVRPNNTLIVGKNGAGKSTILDALTFVLFGKPFRRINKPQLINSINEKNCMVEIDFTIGTKKYHIKRGINPNLFEVHENGKELEHTSSVKDFQKKLEKNILKMNYKSFTQIVILGSSSFTPFMKLPPHHRRSVIEDILDIGIFSLMNNALKTRSLLLKDDLTEISKDLSIQKEKVRLQREYIESLEKKNDQQKEKIETKIRENESDIKALEQQEAVLNKSVSILLGKIKNADDINKKYQKCLDLQKEAERKRNEKSTEIVFFEENKESDCPTCNQRIGQDFAESCIHGFQDELEGLEKALSKMGNTISTLSDTINTIDDIQTKIQGHQQDLHGISINITNKRSNIKQLEEEITALSTSEDTAGAKDNLVHEEEKLESIEEDRYRKKGVQNTYNTASLLLRDSGIKTKIIERYLPIMNQLINQYLTEFDFFVNFNLDENFNEEIKSRHRDEFSYDSFSEGEKQRIDLAILFCWREIAKMRNSVSTNLLILDELFDSSLDSEGTDDFLKIISVLEKQGDNLFIISHKTDVLLEVFEDVLEFEKVGDFSTLKDKE